MTDLERRVQAAIDRQPFAGLLGIQLKEVEKGRVTVCCPMRSELGQQTGTFHGGVIAAVAEAVGGYVLRTVVSEEWSAIGVEYKINFLRAAAGSAITATATIVKSGRQLSVADVEVYDADSGKMVAKMLSTMVVQKTEG